MDITKLLRPNKIAVIGASEKPGFGCDTCTNIIEYMEEGSYYFVSPTRDSVFGRRCYKSYADIPEQVDLMVICTPMRSVYGVIEEGIAHGAKAAVVFASGYGESGEEGRLAEAELTALCKRHDFPVMGPNCAGFINTRDKLYPFAFISESRDRTGSVGLVCQSGQFVLSLMDNPLPRFSYAISSGNAKITQLEDYLDFLVEDDGTSVIALYIEGVNDPVRFTLALRRAAQKNKPVVALKVGRSEKGRSVAASHTGSLAGSDRVFDAVFEKFGVIRVDDLEELMATAHALSVLKTLPAGPGLAAVALSGGETGVCADTAHMLCLEYPDFAPDTVEKLRAMLPSYAHVSNPLDMTATLSYDTDKLTEAYGIMMRDPNVDFIVAGYTLLEEIFDPCIYYLCEALERLSKEPWAVPVVMVPFMENTRNREYTARLEAAGVPVLPSSKYAFNIIKQILWRASYKMEEHDLDTCAPALHKNRVALGESASKAKLLGILPTGRGGVAATREEACRLYDAIAQEGANEGVNKAVLKIESPDILHKTDAGCVKLNIDSRESAKSAYDEIIANAKKFNAAARIDGVQVTEQLKSGGLELMLGVKSDPQFGPCILLGLGGIYVELLNDTALALAPISAAEAQRMMDSLKSKKLLYGYRGSEPLDTDALRDTIVKLSRYAAEHSKELVELDINPVFLYRKGQGLMAADTLYIMDTGEE